MFDTRAIGCTHGYVDPYSKDYSSLALGMLARAVGHGLKVAYVDMGGKATKLTNFLENLSLSYAFVKQFDRLRIDTFTFKANGKVSRTIIPLVEFHMLPEDMFWQLREYYDLVIFDQCDEALSTSRLDMVLQRRHQNTEMVFIYTNHDIFRSIASRFINSCSLSHRHNPSLTARKVLNLTGEGNGKSCFSYGYLLRSFMARHDVKLVSFDKGGDFHGELVFFYALKRWCQENTLYGRFDYVVTGMNRFDGKEFREEPIPEDMREAREGLMLLQTALKKQTPVIADELNAVVSRGLLSEDEIVSVIEGTEHELVMTGAHASKQLLSLSGQIIEFTPESSPKEDIGIRRGIDF